MKVIKLEYNSELWLRAIEFADNCSWIAGKHLSGLMKRNAFTDWEAVFVAMEGDEIAGYCTFLKEDYYPDKRYSPWISTVFVDEKFRGNRISHSMIANAIEYAKKCGFKKVYIPSDMVGFYEKCGFTPIDKLKNYGGDFDTIFMREI